VESRFFILGSEGYIGDHLARFYEKQGLAVYRSGRFMVRLENHHHLERTIRLLKPSHLIHVCRYADGMDRKKRLDSFTYLMELCVEQDVFPILISSDLVFGGRGGPYSEEDSPEAEDLGLVMPRLLERIVGERYRDRCAVIRVPRVWSENVGPRNRQRNPLAEVYAALDGEAVKTDRNVYRDLLHWRSLAEGLLRIKRAGLYHFSESWDGNLREAAEYFAQALGAESWLLRQHLLDKEDDDGQAGDFRLRTERTEQELQIKFSSSRRKITEVLKKNG